MKLAKVRDIVRQRGAPDAAVLEVAGEEQGHGTVLWVHEVEHYTGQQETEFVVHSWANVYTDDQPIAGGMLWGGTYCLSLKDAMAEFDSRTGRKEVQS